MTTITNTNEVDLCDVDWEPDMCQCANPERVLETRGVVTVSGGEVLDTRHDVCYCARCGGIITPEMLLASLEAELSDLLGEEVEISF